jgi:hypothetical protein
MNNPALSHGIDPGFPFRPPLSGTGKNHDEILSRAFAA